MTISKTRAIKKIAKIWEDKILPLQHSANLPNPLIIQLRCECGDLNTIVFHHAPESSEGQKNVH